MLYSLEKLQIANCKFIYSVISFSEAINNININEYVRNFILIPNHFFTPEIIIKRKPLAENARRAGWVGCNINIADIPQSGKIYIVKDGIEIDRKKVIDDYAKSSLYQRIVSHQEVGYWTFWHAWKE